jgi:hypothetical protein
VNHWRSRRCVCVCVLFIYWSRFASCRLLTDEHRRRIRQRCLFFVDEADDTASLKKNAWVDCNSQRDRLQNATKLWLQSLQEQIIPICGIYLASLSRFLIDLLRLL